MLQAVKMPGMATPEYRQVPHNIEMEQGLLGAILVNNEALDKIEGMIEADDFYDPVHAEIYAVTVQMIQGGSVANPVTLKNHFENAPPISDGVSIVHYLGRLAINAAVLPSLETYARDLRSLAMRRQIIDLAQAMAETAYDSPIDSRGSDQVEAAERELLTIAERNGSSDGATPFAISIHDAVTRIEAAYKNNKSIIGLSTGLSDLDRATGGLVDGLLYVPAGRPGMGKTAIVVCAGWNAAKNGIPVLMFSLEMPKDQIAERILSYETRIDSERLRMGHIDADESRLMAEMEIAIRSRRFYIDDRGAVSIDQLCARARRHHRKHGTRLILVDYLQLLSGSGRRSDNRVNELTEITGKLKALAKELRVPVVALSQLSRAVENRDNKRPLLSDLRESGSIEQDADLVLFLYRHAYYLEKEKPNINPNDPNISKEDRETYTKWQSAMSDVAGKAEVIIAKNRFGRTTTVELMFHGATTSFHNLAGREAPHGR